MRDGWPIASAATCSRRARRSSIAPADWPRVASALRLSRAAVARTRSAVARGRRFLARGPAPVFMGFGSLMPTEGSQHLDDTLAMFEEAARLAGCRAIVQAEVDLPRHRSTCCSSGARRTRSCSPDARPSSIMRRGHDTHDASRRRAVDPGAARVRSVRVGRRAASAWRGAEDVAAHEAGRAKAGVAHHAKRSTTRA